MNIQAAEPLCSPFTWITLLPSLAPLFSRNCQLERITRLSLKSTSSANVSTITWTLTQPASVAAQLIRRHFCSPYRMALLNTISWHRPHMTFIGGFGVIAVIQNTLYELCSLMLYDLGCGAVWV